MGEIEEACPDIEVIITIRIDGKIRNSVEICINKSRFVRELKQSLAPIPEVGIHPASMQISAGDIELEDDFQICMYDVETDDELFLDHVTGTTTSTTTTADVANPQMASVDNVV